MGAIVFAVMLLGFLGAIIFTFNTLATRAGNFFLRFKRTPVARGPIKPTAKTSVDLKLAALVETLDLEGYLDHKPMTSRLELVEDEVILDLLKEIHKEVDLRYCLPALHMRLKRVPGYAPNRFKETYDFIVATRSHGIGFTLPA